MGSRRTTIVNTSTTVAPKQPPAQPLVQSGRIAGAPVTYTVGATRRVSPAPDLPVQVQRYNPFRTAWGIVPYVPYRPTNVYNPVVRPVTPVQSVVNNRLSSAGTIKDDVCSEILGDPLSGVDNFVITGNGSAARFRFPVSGAPSEIAVFNTSTNETVPGDQYDVLIRGNSVSWIIFDVPPASGVSYDIKYVIGDSPFIRNVRVGTWTTWLVQLNNLQRQLLSAKTSAQSSISYRFGYSTTDNRIPESAAYDAAIEAVIQLKSLIKAPGQKMDLKSIEAACNNIEDQLQKINAGTGKRAQADSTVGGPLITPPAITRGANIVFEFDDRYSSFSPQGGEFFYNGRLYTRQFDSQVRASFFDLNSGRFPPRYYSGGGGGGEGSDGNDKWFGREGTGVTGGKGGVKATDSNNAPSGGGGGSSGGGGGLGFGDSAVDVGIDDAARDSGGGTGSQRDSGNDTGPKGDAWA